MIDKCPKCRSKKWSPEEWGNPKRLSGLCRECRYQWPLGDSMAFLQELAVLLKKYDVELFATDFGHLRADVHFSDEESMPDQRGDAIFFEGDYGVSCNATHKTVKKMLITLEEPTQ